MGLTVLWTSRWGVGLRAHRIRRQINPAGPDDRAMFDKDLPERRRVGQCGKHGCIRSMGPMQKVHDSLRAIDEMHAKPELHASGCARSSPWSLAPAETRMGRGSYAGSMRSTVAGQVALQS